MNAPPTALRPRKSPRQRRAVETRDRIVDAAARIFGEHGYAHGTTNRIAEEAGISVGSLYQYFPNKDAILVCLAERHVADGTDLVLGRLAAARPIGVVPMLRQVVESMIDLHRNAGRLHQVLFEEAPRPAPFLTELHDLEDRIVATVTEALRADPAVTVADPEVAARMLVVGIESYVHRMVATARPPLEPAVLAAELVELYAGYLTSPPG
jgi:AcrR family transcriptional regulator